MRKRPVGTALMLSVSLTNDRNRVTLIPLADPVETCQEASK